jgi:hypothetical protein
MIDRAEGVVEKGITGAISAEGNSRNINENIVTQEVS